MMFQKSESEQWENRFSDFFSEKTESEQTAESFITEFKLEKHPAGCGYFWEYSRVEAKSSAIVTVFKGDQISSFHKTKTTDQTITYIGGNAAQKILILTQSGEIKKITLDKQNTRYTVPKNTWFALYIAPSNENNFSVATHLDVPAFEFSDLVVAKKEDLLEEYSDIIKKGGKGLAVADAIGKYSESSCRHKESETCTC